MRTTLILFSVLLAPAAHASDSLSTIAGKLSVSPESAFQKESTSFTFRLPVKSAPAGTLLLVTTDATGKILREMGPLNDSGVMGDETEGDLTYSRKIHIKEKNSGRLHIGVISTDELQAPALGTTSVLTSVEILDRPTFAELMGKIWDRVT